MAGEEAKYVFLYSEADKDKNKQNVKSKEYVVLKRRTSKDGFIDTEKEVNKEDQNVEGETGSHDESSQNQNTDCNHPEPNSCPVPGCHLHFYQELDLTRHFMQCHTGQNA